MSAEPTATPVLETRQLTVTYDGEVAVDNLNLTVFPGEVVAVLGPSGSGKSTLLNTVAGFQHPTSGEVWLNGRRVADPHRAEPPERRDVAVVFQNYALWPHLSALETVAYPIRRRGARRRAAHEQAMQILRLLRISHLAGRRPAELSGGEQQRVGLARALARQASLYLFDEPTAHLDSHVRGVFLEELVARREGSGAGGLYATHDAEEALGLASRVALLNAGRLIQIGPPGQVYAEPANLWAARLTGPASILRARVVDADSTGATIETDGVVFHVQATRGTLLGAETALLVRPGWARLGGQLAGTVRSVRFRGPHSDHLIQTSVGEVLIREPGPPRQSVGDAVSWSLSRVWFLDDVRG